MLLFADVALGFVVGLAAALVYQSTRRGRRWTVRLHYAFVAGLVGALAVFVGLVFIDLANLRGV